MVDWQPQLGNFPLGIYADTAQKKAQLEQQQQQINNQDLQNTIGTIGTIANSLAAKRKTVAQALALGKQFDIPDEVSRNMDPSQVLQVGAIKKGQVDMQLLMSMLHPGAYPNSSATATSPTQPTPATPNVAATPTIKPEAVLASASPTIPMPAQQPDSEIAPPSTGQMPVPIAAPPIKPQMVNKATLDAYEKMKKVPVITTGEALKQGSVDKGTIIKNQKLELGTKEEQFYQREWDKLLKESDPLNASSRTPLGIVSRANFQANRGLKTLSNPVVTNQEAGNVMADIAAIYQNGSPTQFGMSHQQYDTLYGKAQGLVQLISGNPQDALPDNVKNRLVNVLKDMKQTNAGLLKQRLDMTEHSKKAVISHFPQEWKEYRDILEGNQDAYNGLAPAAGTPLPGLTPAEQAEFETLHKKFGNKS